MNLVDLEIHGTAQSAADKDQMLVILKEVGGERILPIVTSQKRALLLMAHKMVPVPLPAPLSVADIWHLMFDKMQLQIKRVVITSMSEGHCFASVVGEKDGEEVEIKFCNAADGLVVSTTFNARLCIDEELLQAQYMRKVGDNAYALHISTVSRSMLEGALQQAIDTENYEAASKLKAELDKRKPADGQPS